MFKARYESFFFKRGEEGRGNACESLIPLPFVYENADANGLE